MLRFSLIIAVLLMNFTFLMGNTFYIDPINGDISGDGSVAHPWSTLEEVIANNMIRTYKNSPLPYDAMINQLVLKNENGIINGGDTLVLLEGLHGDVYLSNFNNHEFITVVGAEGHQAILKSLKLQACTNWRFVGVDISSEPYGSYLNNKLVFIESHGWQGPTKRIGISNCDIYSTDSAWTSADDWLTKASDGVFILADSVNVENNRIRNVDMGLTARGNHISMSHNQVVNFSGDGMRILGSFVLAEYNTIKNCYKVDENHDDGIQSFTTNGLVVDHNIIRSNIIQNYEDPDQPLLGVLQGMGFFDGPYNGWIVENNVISVDHYHGITFLGAHDCIINNNTVIDPTPDITPDGSWIMIADAKDGTKSTNCIATNNVANKIIVDGLTASNVTLDNYDAYRANFIDYALFNFHLKSDSELIDQGDVNSATIIDVEGTPRTYGLGPDIGAYEYKTPNIVSNIWREGDVLLYPNPFKNKIHIESNLDFDKSSGLYFEWRSMDGSLVRMGSLVRDMDILGLENLKEGSYIFNVINKKKEVVGSTIVLKMK